MSEADDGIAPEIVAAVSHFAGTQIAVRDDLHGLEQPPGELWRAMGDAGLFALALPEKYGGKACNFRTLGKAAEAFAHGGGNLGLTVSWLAQQLSSTLHILRHGSDTQKDDLLPKLAAGSTTLAIAISEPDAGAHPKYLTTRAERQAGGWRLDGEKSYLTRIPTPNQNSPEVKSTTPLLRANRTTRA